VSGNDIGCKADIVEKSISKVSGIVPRLYRNGDSNLLLGLRRGGALGAAVARDFIGAAFGAASGIGADPAAAIGFDLAEERVVAEGPAGVEMGTVTIC
jgi:hypothetical protein